jgi:hypothetical protein
MTAPTLATLQWIKLVADVNTNVADAETYAGKIVGIRPEDIATLGSGPDSPGKLFGVRGYPRSGGLTGTEFVMLPNVEPITARFIATIPPEGAWKLVASRQVYRNAADILIDTYGVPAGAVRTALKSLYDAAVANNAA